MVSTIEGTLKHALFLARHLNKSELQCATVAVLLELGISTKRMGFDYLKKGIVLFCEDPSQMITKEIYPAIGNQYTPEVDTESIEQTIRSAITDAWRTRDEKVWRYFFPTDENGRVSKPSNAEFISRIGRFLELWQGCCKEVAYEKEY